MSIFSKSDNRDDNMVRPSFHEFKKQASFFFKEKIKSARLALTDVTPAQLMTEEAINGNPDTRNLGFISRSAFELDDYWRIVEILHKRLVKFEKKYWRVHYNSLIVLEHLLTHGPESIAEEFQGDKHVISEMTNFQYIDEKGFNWGLTVRKKSDRILSLLEKGPLLKDERDRARKLTREIRGFGKFCERSSSQNILQEPSSSSGTYRRYNSHFISLENQDDSENQVSGSSRNDHIIEKQEDEFCLKENIVPEKELNRSNVLLLGNKTEDEGKHVIFVEDGRHPFSNKETQSSVSLLSAYIEPIRMW